MDNPLPWNKNHDTAVGFGQMPGWSICLQHQHTCRDKESSNL